MEVDETRAPFNVEAYAASAYAQGKNLDSLDTELSEKHQKVQRALSSLINQRYEDFLGLSTSLTGIDTTLGELRTPLNGVKGEIHAVRAELAAKLEYIDSRLAYRAQLREKKQVLRLFLDLGQLLDRVAAVLREAEASDEQAEYVKCLERAAVDMSQVRYFAKKGGGYAYVRDAQQRIQEVEQSLLSALERFLARSVSQYVELAASTTAQQQQQDMASTDEAARLIAQSLRAYGAVEETERAEAIMRSSMVRPFAARVFGAQPGRGMGLEPDAFAEMLREVLRFVETTAVPLARGVEAHLAAGGGSGGIRLATRVFWREISASMIECLPLVFVPGMPERFHRNYREACGFACEFSRLFSLGGGAAVDGVPDHSVLALDPAYVEFSRKWQLSAYFSIQKKHIIGALEGCEQSPASGGSRPGTPLLSSLSSRAPAVDKDAVARIKAEAGLLTEQAARAVWAIKRCWAPEVYLEPLASRCWQLTMQILLWYQQAVDRSVRQLIQSNASVGGAQALESPEIGELLHHMHDTFAMRTAACEQTRLVGGVIPAPAAGSGDAGGFKAGILASMESAVGQAFAPLDATVERAAEYMAAAVAACSTENLGSQLRRTTSQFRHTNRQAPTAASAYVAKLFALLAAVEAKIDGAVEAKIGGAVEAKIDRAGQGEFGRTVKHMLRTQVAAGVSREIARACGEALATISKTEASLQRLRKPRGAGRADASGAGRADTGGAGDLPVPPGVDL
ncbi:hypothetical protein IWW50_004920, partial [Coemansia erecta]